VLLAGIAAALSPVSAQTDLDAPSQPTNPLWRNYSTGTVTESVAAERESLRATWSTSTDSGTGVAQYRLQVGLEPGFAEPLLDRLTGSTKGWALIEQSDGIRYGKSYYFRVAARDVAGNESSWSAPSNRVDVTDQTTGPAVAHAPVLSGYVGQSVPIRLSASCGGVEQSCSARLYWRATPLSGATALLDGVGDSGWQVADLSRGAETTLESSRAWEWSGMVPGSAVSTSGVDYVVEATDTFARTHVPGGAFVGSANATGVQPAAHGFFHVHIVSPPLPAHAPPPFGRAGEALALRLDATCATANCTATLYYRSTDAPVSSTPLTATPAWPRVPMSRSGEAQSLGDAGAILGFTASIPASTVDSRGVDYFMEVSDGTTRAWWPGTTAQGYYAPTDGMRTGYHHVHVLEPPHVVHEPVVASAYRQPVPVRAQASCQTTCTAALYYRTTTSAVLDTTAAFTSVPMTVSVPAAGVVTLEGEVPASAADTRGVDYFFSVTDGATTTWWPGTSAVDGYVPVPGTRVGYHHVRIVDPPHLAHAPVATAPALRDVVIETDLTCVTTSCTVVLAYAATPLAQAAAFTEIPMTLVGPTRPTPAGALGHYRGVIPAAKVTTAGLAYWLRATDGHTTTYHPGTSYWGAYVPVDGLRTGAHVVRVLEPPHLLHAPVATAYYRQPVSIEARSNCATPACTATLHWRTTGHEWRSGPMSAERTGHATAAGEVLVYRAEIPAADATTEGVDYWIEVHDGYVGERTQTYHITVLAPTAVLHAPVMASLAGVPLTIEAAVPCATAACDVDLYYRIPGPGLLADPAWTVVDMPAEGLSLAVGDATTVALHRAVVPSEHVTTRGLEYFIRASDGHTTAYSPGSAYVATQVARVDGRRVNYFSVHVAEPVRVLHQPPASAQLGDPIPIAATANCATNSCTATLAYRATPSLATLNSVIAYASGGPAFTEVAMEKATVTNGGGAGRVLEFRALIPGEVVTASGVDYWLRVSDGATTAYYPGTSYISGAGSVDGIRAAWHHVAVTTQRVTATIGDLVWVDRDRDAVKDSYEVGLGGVGMRVSHAGLDGAFGTADDVVVATQTTTAAGAYGFTGLLPGTYRVEVLGASLPAHIEAVTGQNPRLVTLVAGERRTDVDFGYRWLERGAVTGEVWVDYDADAARDADDEALAGAQVSGRWAGDDDVFDTADDRTYGPVPTDSTGRTTFSALPEGLFRLAVDATSLPVGLELVSGANPAEIRLAPLAAATVGFGYRWTGVIDVVVWDDTDGDDAVDAPERLVPGATVVVSAPGPDGTLGTADDKVLGTKVSDAAGRALFPYLAPGTRRVAIADRLVVTWEVRP